MFKILIILLGVSSFSCSTSNLDLAVVKNQYPIVLYVSSQDAGYVDPVNIVIKIDTQIVVNQDFYCGSGHNFVAFNFNLTEGTHRIVVESNNGKASLDKIFVVEKKKWLVLDYLGKNNFRFTSSDQRIGIV